MSNDGNTAGEAMAVFSQAEADKQKIAELEARLASYEADRVAYPQFNGEVPKYQLNSPCYLDDQTLHMEGEVIEFTGVPNLEMVPLNDAAKARMDEYISEQEGGARAYADKRGRPFTGLSTDMGEVLARMLQDARHDAAAPAVHIASPELKGEVAIMSHHAAEAQRKRGRPPKSSVVSSKAPVQQKIMPQPVSSISAAPPGGSPWSKSA